MLAALAGRTPPATAQTVVEVQGGGSSLTGGYGAAANVWRKGVEGWVGLGYLDGVRVGAFLRKAIGKDTLRLGNDALVIRYPTDVFGSGYNLLVQGASYARTQGRTGLLAFGGASSQGLAAPAFFAAKAQAAIGALFVEHRLSSAVHLTTSAIFADRQTVVPGIQWQATPDITTAVVGGVGAGRPYAAASLVARSGVLGVKASYVYNPRRFRRASAPAPLQTDVDRENVEVTYQINPDFSVGVARQHFVQDSADISMPSRAWGNSIFLGGRTGELRLSAGLYDSHSDSISNLSSFAALGRQLASWLDAELFVLQSRPHGRSSTTTPIVNLRERVSPRVGLVQQITLAEGRPRMQLGGSLLTPIGEFAVDYAIVHQPFQPFNPFRSALTLTARLQLGRYSTSFGTYVQPDGTVDYAASGSTFLYMGALGGVQPHRLGGGGIARYVVRGRVLDESGAPVEGAAIDFAGEATFTNSRGEFLLRVRQPRRFQPRVLLDDFLLPGRWRVRQVPDEVTAEPEDRARPIEIRLEHAIPVLPDNLRPEPSDTLLPLVSPARSATALSGAPARLIFGAMHPDVFTSSWAAAWGRELNASSAYREAAANWEGGVVLQMGADAALGVPEPRAVWLDLHHGICREARPATRADLSAAKYLIEADAAVWKELLAGRLSPITALLAGKLRLAQGSLLGLLPYATAAQLLVATASVVQQQFPESSL